MWIQVNVGSGLPDPPWDVESLQHYHQRIQAELIEVTMPREASMTLGSPQAAAMILDANLEVVWRGDYEDDGMPTPQHLATALEEAMGRWR